MSRKKPRKQREGSAADADMSQSVGTMQIRNPLAIMPDAKFERGIETPMPVKPGDGGFYYYRGPERMTVARSLRDDPLARLHDRGQITDALYYGGRAYQRHLEAREVGKLRSSGDLRDPVDGNPPRQEPLTDRMQEAIRQLAMIDGRVEDEHGLRGVKLIRLVLGNGLFMNQVAQTLSMVVNRATTEYLSRFFKECLGTVGKATGYGC